MAQSAESAPTEETLPPTTTALGPSETTIGGDGTIIVTGTLLRGIGPVGDDVIVLPRARIEETGAATTAELLQSIPQLPSFNSLQFPSARCNCQTVNRPNLRGLTPLSVTGSSTTLVMVDGHRIVGMGVLSTTPDPDIIPPDMIERVEMVLEGGSAIYGSDAVAGVMNFVTRRDIEGVKLRASYGLAEDYHTFNINAAAGTTWEGGSAFLSYSYVEHDAVFGRDRDFVRQFPRSVPGIASPVTGLGCTPGNVQVAPTGTVYALPFTGGGGVAGSTNQCDESDDVTIYPREHFHSLFTGVTQELSDTVELDIRGYYLDRREWQTFGRFYAPLVLGPPSIFGFPTGLPVDSPFRLTHLISGNPFEIQQVHFSIGDEQSSKITAALRSWGITPYIKADIGKGWQLRGFVNFGYSRTEAHTGQPQQATFQNAISAGLLNPYNPGASDPSALATVTDFEVYGLTRQRMYNARLVADGDLIDWPGGPVKLALGGEFLRERVWLRDGPTVPGAEITGYDAIYLPAILPGRPLTLIRPAGDPLPTIELSRDILSLFGQLVVPLFGPGNGRPGIDRLTLSASGRYDDYSDVGGTFNPKLGIDYWPVDWVRLRGSWSRSFVAPSLVDLDEAVLTQLGFGTNAPALFPPRELIADGTWPAPKPGQNTVAVLTGSMPDLRPQQAQSLSLGTDLQPPFVPGLNLGLTYWKTDYKQGIGVPPFASPGIYWRQFGELIITNPTLDQLAAAAATADVLANSPCAPLPGCLYAIVDARRRNILKWELDGLDFTARYTHPTSFGSINMDIDGSYGFHFKIKLSPSANFFDTIAANASRFRLRASLGAQIDQLRVSVTLNHTGGYDLDPPVGIEPQQTHVGAFDVVNLFVKYDFADEGVFKGLVLSLNVDNVFDQDPPAYREYNGVDWRQSGYANGSTLGRLVRLGVETKF